MGFENADIKPDTYAYTMASHISKQLRANAIVDLASYVGSILMDSGASIEDIKPVLQEQAALYNFTGDEFDLFCGIIQRGFQERDNKVSSVVN